MVKEGVEDYKRYKLDKETNNKPVDVLDPATGQYVTRTWKDVRVGDIVIVTKDQQFPTDLLFLSSESEEGTCYIETMNLDGETNLKIKQAPDDTKDFPKAAFAEFRDAVIECEGPNPRLYQFTGNLLIGGKTMPISPSAILLRGCNLRNTDVAVGAVIYAGHETKIFKNSAPSPSKRSHLERHVDKIIIFMFSLLFSFCICGAVYFAIWTRDKSPKHWYLAPTDTSHQYDPTSPSFVGFASFITSFILYGYLIPISLYVSIEMVKIAQSMGFINNDRDMYHAETDTPALARTSNLNEELGMVNTVLSDKTGTLTRNVMEFFKCSIAGVAYGAGVTEIEKANALRKGTILDDREQPGAAQYRERFYNFYDARLMGDAWNSAHDPGTVEMFFRLLAVCHTVVPDGPTEPDTIKYEAESPDEAALVVAAKVFGFFFFKRTNTTVVVRERTARGEVDVEYEVLNVLEFNSTRKRMSVVVKEKANEKIIIFTKGADTVIYERLDPKYAPNDAMKESTSKHMEEFGAGGLRTLCLSYTEVDREWYNNTWMPEWVAAKTSLTDRDRLVSEASEKIEKDLRLLGCTAIEDKLQEGVPECIRQLALAGIRIWVLTGDKMETAINIAFACSLLTEDMHQFTISVYGVEEIEKAERDGDKVLAERLSHQAVAESIATVEQAMNDKAEGSRFAIVIDGKALAYALSKDLSPAFLRVGLRCKAVVCCRVSPLQKAQVTSLVRSHGDTTLAIGDGANDVGMIQSAHIGVGISGQEGMQAVMSSDFAIAQFRFLTPLLLVHGRYSYKRISRMVLFFFYKNMLFGVTIFAFNAFNGFSGQFIYNDFYMTLFNVVFTALTPIVIGIFDRDVDKEMALKYPGLYIQGQRNEYFNFRAISLWLLSSLYQCSVIMVFVLWGCRPTTSDRASGQPYSMWQTGVLMFTCVVVTVHFQVVQITETWTWAHHLSIWLSQAVWWLYLLAYGVFPLYFSTDLYNLFVGIVSPSAQYWLYVLLVPAACQLPDFFLRMAQKQLYPADHQVVQEIQKKLQREGRSVADERGQVAPSILASIFSGKPNKNKGFVPPYDSRSRFYGLVSSSARNTGRIDTGTRSPVLTHLDQELTDNPYRNRKKSPLPGIAPGPRSPTGPAVMPVAEGMQPSGHAGAEMASASAVAAGRPVLPPIASSPPGAHKPGLGHADLMPSNGSDAPAHTSVPMHHALALAPLPPRTKLPPIHQTSPNAANSSLAPGAIASPTSGPLALHQAVNEHKQEMEAAYAAALR
ncbi:Phospholipid-transporting ATPase 3 [Tetrabaena socialis]|uniref:Phospholipid-transporting ATPase n=1 Tax=Tetrabaena socialis TaxID=47790 RepID=A0A2J7ZYP4_9CHLO|nr:Phospholipid-transporting ATPase 3 [Tetrabaena socialis]|eukprot:PNH05393.1 Phospholipid-transporting ATPase 3 [Tetrabaena socialis]